MIFVSFLGKLVCYLSGDLGLTRGSIFLGKCVVVRGGLVRFVLASLGLVGLDAWVLLLVILDFCLGWVFCLSCFGGFVIRVVLFGLLGLFVGFRFGFNFIVWMF